MRAWTGGSDESGPLFSIEVADIDHELFEIDYSEVFPDIQSQPSQMSLQNRPNLKKPFRFREDE